MLIAITEHCSMGCYHCMSDCKPNGKHMTFDTLHKVIEAANKIHPHFDYTKTTKSPKCTNTRLMLAQGLTDLAEMTEAMTAHGKYCFPYIGYDGSVRPGESLLCPSLGHIWEPETVIKNLSRLRCTKCRIALKIAMSNPITAICCRQVF